MSKEREENATEETREEAGAVSLEKAAEESPESPEESEGNPNGAQGVMARFKAGAKNMSAGIRHTVTTGHQSDEEIRRILVERQLKVHESVRETAREELDEVYKRIRKLELRAAEDGWTDAEKQEITSLRAERKARERALKDLLKVEFSPAQPSRDQIRRARGMSGTRRVVGLTTIAAASAGMAYTVPQTLFLAVPIGLGLTFWKGGQEPALGQRPIPERLLRPELDPTPLSDLTPEQQAEQEEQEDLSGPTALRDVSDAQIAHERIRRALLKESIKTRIRFEEIGTAQRTPWGWQTSLILSDGTAADLLKKSSDLDRAFRVGAGRTLIAGSREDTAQVTLRALVTDPFANPPGYPTYAPNSRSLLDPIEPFAVSIDGNSTPIVVGGHILIVADTGGGKSMAVRSIADHITACRDAVAVDIDTSGRGLGPLRSAAVETAYTNKAAEALLKRLEKRAKARIAALPDTQEVHKATPEAPAIVAFVDEWPQLPSGAVKTGINLLRIGRKAKIFLVVMTQDATEDVLGDSIADSFHTRIMLPCRQPDVPVVVGRPTAISEGWLPHILVAGDEEDPGDSGRCYIISKKYREPILRYVIPLDAETALKRAKERVAAEGRPTLRDDESSAPSSAPMPPFARTLVDLFEEKSVETLTVAQIVEELAKQDPQRWCQWDDREDRLALAGREIKALLQDAGLTVPTIRLPANPRPTAYRLEDLQAALDDLS
ncbi:type IV secretory system conjugative DNA transfer family protein [Streptomyces sp. VTCC 41912]|uniref:type IV secretory system conjugative DNA transfer family protein n=1 Tax=Streptomyces sp. VTCC 41912 TaxID=3383243 RepID=UPI003896DC74